MSRVSFIPSAGVSRFVQYLPIVTYEESTTDDSSYYPNTTYQFLRWYGGHMDLNKISDIWVYVSFTGVVTDSDVDFWNYTDMSKIVDLYEGPVGPGVTDIFWKVTSEIKSFGSSTKDLCIQFTSDGTNTLTIRKAFLIVFWG